MSKYHLELKDLEVSYPKATIGPINLQIEPGIIHALIGTNGAGKTTILKTIIGILNPNKGEKRYFDKIFNSDNIEFKKEISYVPDQFDGPKHWNAMQLERFYQYWYPNWDSNLYRELLNELEVPQKTAFERLSAGNKKKLLYSLGLAAKPSLLILDEPTNGLDILAKQQLRARLTEFMETENHSVLITSHQLEEVEAISDMISILDRGQLLGTFTQDQVKRDWKIFWVPSVREDLGESVVRIEKTTENLYKIISSDEKETSQILANKKIPIIRVQSLDLEQIFTEMIQANRKNKSFLSNIPS